MGNYEPIRTPRFRRETVPGGYELVIPARKNWLALPFLTFWLVMWTMGGGAAIVAAVTQREPFMGVWLIFWALAWVLVGGQLVYMLTGSEFVRYSGGDLEIGFRSALFRRTRRYQSSAITQLAASEGVNPFGRAMRGMQGGPFAMLGMVQTGAIRFNYGARTIYAGSSLDFAEGQLIVTELLRSLPATR